MKVYVLVGIAAVAVCLLGCQSPGTRHGAMRHRDHRAAHSTVAQVIEVKSFPLGEKQPVGQILRLPDIAGAGRTWKILVGPNDESHPATTEYSNTEPNILVENGWVYVVVQRQSMPATAPDSGTGSRWGQARTARVTATAEGTRFIVQQQGDLHRVILLSDPPDTVDVTLTKPKADAQTLVAAGMYIEVGPSDDHLPPAQDVASSTSGLAELVAYIDHVAGAAGVK